MIIVLTIFGTLVAVAAFAVGLSLGMNHRDGVNQRWLLRNAWVLERQGDLRAAGIVRRLAHREDVLCDHGFPAGNCGICRRERTERGETIA